MADNKHPSPTPVVGVQRVFTDVWLINPMLRFTCLLVVAFLLRAGKVAFEFFQPTLPGGAFQYMTLPENKEEEELFNKLMTTFTKTMDVGIAMLHVGVLL